MTKQLQYSSGFLALLLVVLLIGAPAFAGEAESVQEYNGKVYSKIAELEGKYAIGIDLPDFESDTYSPLGTATLSTLDAALDYITPQIIKQLSSYYFHRNGQKLRIVFTYSDNPGRHGGEAMLAGFIESTSVIQIFIPAPGTVSLVTGCTPTAIVHEVGHAFLTMYGELHGYQRLKQEWTSFNRGISYNAAYLRSNPDDRVFISGYAATDYEEDFAETFAHAFVCNRDGMGLSGYLRDEGGNRTPLGRKFSYIETMLPRYLTNTSAATANLQKAYSANAALTYKDARLSGSYLEFIGYNPPNRILSAMLDALGLEEASCTISWITEIGGWNVVDYSQAEYILFPDGTWGQMKKRTSRTAA